LYAIKAISEVHEAGGKILSFLSYCGGLPAPGTYLRILKLKVHEILILSRGFW